MTYHFFNSDKITVLLNDSDNNCAESGTAYLKVKLTMHWTNLSLKKRKALKKSIIN